MKKIIYIIAAIATALSYSSCSETWEDNPVLGVHDGDPVINFLNVPEMENMAVDITEANNDETFNLVCSQPTEYGYAASAGYQVEVSLTSDFAKSILLPTIFKKCDAVKPTRRMVAEAMCKLLDIKEASQIPTPYTELFMRLRANVYTESGAIVPKTAFTSNVVSFKQVSCGYLAIIVPGQKTGIFIRGGMNDWGTPASYEFLTTSEADTYELEYVEIGPNVEFKIASADWGAPNLGDKDGNMPVPGVVYTPGWNTGNLKFEAGFKGSITLMGKDKNWKVIFDAAEPETPGKPSGIFMRGVNGVWDATPALEFKTTDVKGVWSIESVSINGGTSFKVADANWSDVNLGCQKVDGVAQPIAFGDKYALQKGGDNIPVENNFQGSAVLRMKAGKYTLILEETK